MSWVIFFLKDHIVFAKKKIKKEKYRPFVTQTREKLHGIIISKLSLHYFTTQQCFSLFKVVFRVLTNSTWADKIIETQNGNKVNKRCTITHVLLLIHTLLQLYYKNYDNYMAIVIVLLQKSSLKKLKMFSQTKI